MEANSAKFVKTSPRNEAVLKLAQEQMAAKLNHNPDLCEKLIPKWEIGRRRITPGEGYLEAFLRPNVRLVQTPIAKATQTGLQTADGEHHEVDVSKWNQKSFSTISSLILLY